MHIRSFCVPCVRTHDFLGSSSGLITIVVMTLLSYVYVKPIHPTDQDTTTINAIKAAPTFDIGGRQTLIVQLPLKFW